MIDSLKFPNLLNTTTYKQILPISLEVFGFEQELIKSPKTLKDFVYQFQHEKEIFDLQERHITNELEKARKNFFFDKYTVDVFLFASAFILISG